MTAPTARGERGGDREPRRPPDLQPPPEFRRLQRSRATGRMRPDRIYLGWQHALLHPDPGPQPRRPTPPEPEQLNPGWLAAQRREENLLDRPLKLAAGAGGPAGLAC